MDVEFVVLQRVVLYRPLLYRSLRGCNGRGLVRVVHSLRLSRYSHKVLRLGLILVEEYYARNRHLCGCKTCETLPSSQRGESACSAVAREFFLWTVAA